MAEIRDLNPKISMTDNTSTFRAPTTGTTGKREDIEVIAIPNVGKSIEAPTNPTPTSGVTY